MQQLKDSYKNERIFLVGNGPSLKHTPLDELNNEYTFATNQVYKIFPDTNWKPEFYFNCHLPHDLNRIDSGEAITNIKDKLIKNSICFFDNRSKHLFESADDVYFFRRHSLRGTPIDRCDINQVRQFSLNHLNEYWSSNVSNVVYEYHSMYAMMQISAYLGFDEIYLIGCDLGQKYINPHMIFQDGLDPYRSSKSKTEYLDTALKNGILLKSFINAMAYYSIENSLSNKILDKMLSAPSSSHFTQNYIKNIQINDGEYREKQHLKSHYIGKRILEDNGIDIWNATVGGELELYDRKNIFDIV